MVDVTDSDTPLARRGFLAPHYSTLMIHNSFLNQTNKTIIISRNKVGLGSVEVVQQERSINA